MKIHFFETWKIYQASSLGDINKRTKKRGNHPFIYLGQDTENPYKSFGIMLTTKNKDLAIMTLKNTLGNGLNQNIILDNIGYISNEDIVGIWNFKSSKKSHSHASITPEIRKGIIKICKLSVLEKTEKFNNFSLSYKNIDYDFTEKILFNVIKNNLYTSNFFVLKDKHQEQLNELIKWNKDLQDENYSLKENWKNFEKKLIKNNNKIQDLMRDMIVYKSVNKEVEYEKTKQELAKLGLNLEQSKEIENFVEQIIEKD